MNRAIVIGHDAVNALGLVQSLGREGVEVIAILECKKSVLISHSKYVKEIIVVGDFNEAVEVLLTRFDSKTKIPVFPAGDGAALTLAQNYERLKNHFLLERLAGAYTMEQLMVKFNRQLQDTSTVSYIEPLDAEIAVEVEKVRTLMNEVGYLGLFSVEFMHNKHDGRIYFTEVNFRNDGENAFIVHEGVNLPFLHFQDLLDQSKKVFTPSTKSNKYIWEGIHFSGLIRRDISFREWLSDLRGVEGFLYYFKDDKSPFFYQFANKILRRFHLL